MQAPESTQQLPSVFDHKDSSFVKEAVKKAPRSVKIYHDEAAYPEYHQQPQWENFPLNELTYDNVQDFDLDSCDDDHDCDGKYACREPDGLYERALCDERKCCFQKTHSNTGGNQSNEET